MAIQVNDLGPAVATAEAPPLHPHQHAVLVAELRRSEYDGRPADEVFAEVSARHPRASVALKRMGRVRFAPAAKEKLMRARMRRERVDVFTFVDGDWPSGPPGFPNKVLRPWFDRAWTEARG